VARDSEVTRDRRSGKHRQTGDGRPSGSWRYHNHCKSCCDDRLNPRASVDALCYYRVSVALLSDLNACASVQDRSIHEM
jgi:hypothetical protein